MLMTERQGGGGGGVGGGGRAKDRGVVVRSNDVGAKSLAGCFVKLLLLQV